MILHLPVKIVDFNLYWMKELLPSFVFIFKLKNQDLTWNCVKCHISNSKGLFLWQLYMFIIDTGCGLMRISSCNVCFLHLLLPSIGFLFALVSSAHRLQLQNYFIFQSNFPVAHWWQCLLLLLNTDYTSKKTYFHHQLWHIHIVSLMLSKIIKPTNPQMILHAQNIQR